MSTPRFIDILAGFVGIRYDSNIIQTLFVVINILDIFYASCE